MKYQVISSNEWLYPDSEICEAGKKDITLISARGAYTACQILFKGIAPDLSVEWEYIAQGKASEEGWEASPEVYQLIDVPVEINTGPKAFVAKEGECVEGYTTRTAPFRVYDAMKPLKNGALTRSDVEALYICWRIPADAKPGKYEGEISLKIGPEKCSIPVVIEVFSAVVPEKETLYVTNWFSLPNMATRHNIELWSEEHWEMIRKYAKMMRRARQTHFIVPISLMEYKKGENGRYAFDFANTHRFISLFLEEGFTWIEGGHVGRRLKFDNPDFVLTVDSSIKALSPDGYEFLSQYLTAWREFLKENGWLDILVQHVADEPVATSAYQFQILAGIVRKFMPGIPLIDAAQYFELRGSVDIWVPTNDYYQENMDKFEWLRDQGDKLWFYTCCIPGGYYLNRLMDIPLLKSRLLHWGNYKYNLEGFLHWGLNHYEKTQDPFKESCPVHVAANSEDRLPAGDTHIVYPGDDGPWPSMRLELMRAGAEDYELLRILEGKDEKLAEEIVNSILKSFNEAETDADKFEDAHLKLLKAVSG